MKKTRKKFWVEISYSFTILSYFMIIEKIYIRNKLCINNTCITFRDMSVLTKISFEYFIKPQQYIYIQDQLVEIYKIAWKSKLENFFIFLDLKKLFFVLIFFSNFLLTKILIIFLIFPILQVKILKFKES